MNYLPGRTTIIPGTLPIIKSELRRFLNWLEARMRGVDGFGPSGVRVLSDLAISLGIRAILTRSFVRNQRRSAGVPGWAFPTFSRPAHKACNNRPFQRLLWMTLQTSYSIL
jgi:hypothetical protein